MKIRYITDHVEKIEGRPCPYRRFFRTSNCIERLNRELKRRSRVIGIFPSEESLLRLMGSVLIEQHEAMSLERAIYSPDTPAALMGSKVPERLIVIVNGQQ